jgi:MYXO-CTERM domain-containing protein
VKIRLTALSLVFLLFAVPAYAQLSFQIGMVGTAGGVNNWPGGEAPGFAIDGVQQKYLNFAEFRTGVAVAPAAGAAAPTSIQVWTANDEEPRDPVNFSIYGTNAAASGAPGSSITGLNLIASGNLALPAGRNMPGGSNPLSAANSSSASFANATSYPTYVIVFPTVKNPASANSMQIAEVQLFNAAGAGLFAPTNSIVGGQLIPEPSTAILGSLGLALAALRRRRRS